MVPNDRGVVRTFSMYIKMFEMNFNCVRLKETLKETLAFRQLIQMNSNDTHSLFDKGCRRKESGGQGMFQQEFQQNGRRQFASKIQQMLTKLFGFKCFLQTFQKVGDLKILNKTIKQRTAADHHPIRYFATFKVDTLRLTGKEPALERCSLKFQNLKFRFRGP